MSLCEASQRWSRRLDSLAGPLVAAAALLVGLASFAYYFAHGLTLAHYDSKSHLVVARRLTDSVDPGYLQMGVHWLPLIHLLYLPFTLFESQYRSGVGPSLLSVAAFTLSAWLVSRICRRATGSAGAGVAAAAVLVANGNLAYLQSCPLSEPVYMALQLAALDLVMAWRERRTEAPPWAAALAAALGAMCRYEGWFFAAGVVVLLVWDARREPARRRESIRAAAVFAGAFAFLALGHFGYLYARVGDSFLHRVARGNPAPFVTFKRPFLSAAYHAGELAQAGGVVPLLVALLGALHCLRSRRPCARVAPVYLLWLPSITNVSVLYWGMIYRVRWSVLLVPALAASAALQFVAPRALRRALLAASFAAMALPWVSWAAPGTWEFHLLRAGPGAVLLPAAGLAVLLAAESGAAPGLALVALLVAAEQWPALEGENRAVLGEALEHASLEGERAQVIGYLRQNYDGRRILADMGKLAPLVYDSGLATREFVHNEGDPARWRRALGQPRGEVGWLAALRGDEVWQALEVDPHRADGYSLAVQTGHFVLYRLETRPPEGKRIE